MKKCSKCGDEKPATTEYFKKIRANKDGLSGSCRSCEQKHRKKYRQENSDKIREHRKRYRQQNPEKLREYQKKYYQENTDKSRECSERYRQENPVKLTKYKKKWYQENAEKHRERQKKWHQENTEHTKKYYQENIGKIRERIKKWRQENPEKLREHSQKRRARESKLPATLTVEQWEKIKESFNGRCAYCGKENKLEQEHFIPLSKGGEYTNNNIVPACRVCNSSKNAKDFFKWYPTYKHYNRKREKAILKFLGYTGEVQQLSIGI